MTDCCRCECHKAEPKKKLLWKRLFEAWRKSTGCFSTSLPTDTIKSWEAEAKEAINAVEEVYREWKGDLDVWNFFIPHLRHELLGEEENKGGTQ